MTSLMIIEGENAVAAPLVSLVQKAGFSTVLVPAGPEVSNEFDRSDCDLVILDTAEPSMGATDICRQLRQSSAVPVIIVSACATEIDKVVGLEVGADDYVTKPYSGPELIARVRSVLRRSSAANNGDCQCMERGSVLVGGPVRVDEARHLVSIHGSEVHLPLKEFSLLCYLLRKQDCVVTRKELIDNIWGEMYFGDTKTLDVHIKRLRSKIEKDPSNPQIIVNVRGLGFKFNHA